MEKYIIREEMFGRLIYDVKTDRIFLNPEMNEGYMRDARVLKIGYSAAGISAPTTVFWEVTGRCNSQCRHCFNNTRHTGEGDLEYGQAEKLADSLYRAGIFRVKITGGEPFCREDIFHILDLLEARNINFIIYTNGWLINKTFAAQLGKYQNLLYVRVSIDGNKITNDAIRGAGAFGAAMRALRILSDENVRCELNYTIAKNNYMQISEVSKELLSRGIKCKMNLGLVKISGNAMENQELCFLNPDGLEVALRDIKRQIRECANIKKFQLLPDIYYKLFGKQFGCPAGRLTITINNRGDIYPCGLLSGIDEYACGNILEDGLMKAWNGDVMARFRSLEPCQECKSCRVFGNGCTGGCRGNAFHYFKNVGSNDINCNIYKINFYD